ncbi:energy transducer TonB [Hyphococcus sp. DH-69]|uniref:energy transducer TonB family protein n=1 Tax=Hyphococcus formosus TaxID=3143534 RepID=UPI00398AB24D
MIEAPKPSILDRVLLIVFAAGLLAGAIAVALWVNSTNSAEKMERVIHEITVAEVPEEPEEEIVEEEPEPEEVVEETPEPVAAPDPTPVVSDPPKPSTERLGGLDRLADSGSDSFRLAAGGGGGLFGTGTRGGTSWEALLTLHITRALQRDKRTRSAKGKVGVSITVDKNGVFTSAVLTSSTGDPDLDEAIQDVLANLKPLGRGRPSGVNATTNLIINLKRAGE